MGEREYFSSIFALCVKEKNNDLAFISVPHITDHIQEYNSSMPFYKRQGILAENAVLADYSTSLINVICRQDSIRISKQAATLNKTVLKVKYTSSVLMIFLILRMMTHSKTVFCVQFCLVFFI